MTEPLPLKYRAFISYSHADTSRAKWLHRALETFTIDKDLVGRETATGTIPKSLRPIFRDRDEFTAGQALSDQTLAALDVSHALIVICSPASAKSRYVNEEVRLFESRHPERPVIPLIVAGKPGDPEAECFPPALKFKLDAGGKITGEPVELLAADAREEGDGKSLALAKIIAGLLGVSSDDIFRRAQRERRRRQQRWIAGLSVVALALAGLAAWAEINRREAVAQRQEAERNFEVAKQGANSLVFDIAQALRDQQGMRSETVRKILGTAEDVIGKLVQKSEGNLELLHVQAAMLNEFAETYAAQGDTAKQEESARKALAIAERLAAADPANATWANDLSVANISLGDALSEQGNLTAALKAYQESVAIFDRLSKGTGGPQPKLGPAYERIGGVLVTQGNLPDALKAYQQSAAVFRSAAEAEPGNLDWQRDLAVVDDKIGQVLQSQGDLAAALKAYGDGLDIRQRLAKVDPGNTDWQYELGISHERIGDALVAQGDLAGALQSYQVRESIISTLAKSDPENAGWQRDLSVAYTKIGDTQVTQGKLADALATYQEGLAIAERLAKADPGNAQWQRHLSAFYDRIGSVLLAQGDASGALNSLQESRAITEGLAKSDPTNLEWQHDLSITLDRLGDVLGAQNNLPEALKARQDRLAVSAKLAAADPSNAEWQRDLSISYNKLGDLLLQLGKPSEAIAAYQQALAIRQRLAAADPGNASWQRDLAITYARIATVLSSQGDVANALEQFRQGRAIIVQVMEKSPDNAQLPKDLAGFDAAIANLQHSHRGRQPAQAAQ